jgi:hypothetical protein
MEYTGGRSLVTQVHLSGLPGRGVDGSPFALFGCDQWAGCPTAGQPVHFPEQLSAMSSLVLDFRYTLTGEIAGNRDIDMIWDEWVCHSNHPSGIPDCLEVEILPYYNFYFGHYGATFVRTLNVPMTLNRTAATFAFDEFSWGQAVLYIPHKLPGMTSTEMAFDMLPLLEQAVEDYGDPSFSWLMGIEAGTEFGANANQSYRFAVTHFQVTQTLR